MCLSTLKAFDTSDEALEIELVCLGTKFLICNSSSYKVLCVSKKEKGLEKRSGYNTSKVIDLDNQLESFPFVLTYLQL